MGNPFGEAGGGGGDEEDATRLGEDGDLWLLESAKDEGGEAEAKVEKKEEEEQEEEEVLDEEGTEEKRGREEAAFEAWIAGEKYHQMGN